MSRPTPPLRILVTGFESYSSADAYNISREVLKQIAANHPDVEVTTYVLPCTYQQAEKELKAVIARTNPDFVISLGSSGLSEKPVITVETHAESHAYVTDRHEEAPICLRPQEEKITYCAQHPSLNAALRKSLDRQGFDQNALKRSDTAGGFLCEDAFYTALDEQRRAGKKGQAIFLHLNDYAKFKEIDLWAQKPAPVLWSPPRLPTPQQKAEEERQQCLAEEKMKTELAARRKEMVGYYATAVNDLIRYMGEHRDSYLAMSDHLRAPTPTTEQRVNLIYEQYLENSKYGISHPHAPASEMPKQDLRTVLDSSAPVTMDDVKAPTLSVPAKIRVKVTPPRQ